MKCLKKDTVEEFWDVSELHDCLDHVPVNATESFRDALRSYLNPTCELFLTVSGRTALESFLVSVQDRKRQHVFICSYNCYVVANAVTNAGLIVKTFDIDKTLGKIDWERVLIDLDDQVLAVVIPHLFGVPTDFGIIENHCRKHGILVIEDCCHTFGGCIDNVMTGSIGDAAIISFNYDKPISLGGGGALLINNLSLSASIDYHRKQEYLIPDVSQEYDQMMRFVDYLRQRRQNIGRNGIHPVELPVLGSIGNLRAQLGMRQLASYDKVVAVRNANAKLVAGCDAINTWHVAANVTPAWLKHRITFKKPQPTDLIAASIQKMGFRVGNHNWRVTIDELYNYPPQPNAFYLAKNGLDVPIHQNMGQDELRFICDALSGSGATEMDATV